MTVSLVRAGRVTGPSDPLHWDPETMSSRLHEWRVGEVVDTGRDALHALEVVARFVRALDDRPLPDEPFDWEGIDHADRCLVADVLRRAEDACAVFLDVEMRTLCRRGLATLVRHDRGVFGRSQRTDVIAAGLVWATLRVNELREWLDRPSGRPQQLAVAAYMGVGTGSMSGRASSIEIAWNRAGARPGTVNRHSARRRAYLAEIAELDAAES